VSVSFGPPLSFSAQQHSGTKQFYHEVSRAVMERIAALGGVAPPQSHHGSVGARNAE
jgi:hypothetical protein